MNHTGVIYRSKLTDPFLNLAAEDHLLRSRPVYERGLMLYVNDPAVVIGRHQNPWVECNPEYLGRAGIALARRQSGGGTVYHDSGNLNFSILSAREQYDQNANFDVVIEALQTIGVRAERSGRNDLVCGEYKVSGSAFKHLRDRSFHHGTLLVGADLTRLHAALRPAAADINSRGIASVRSAVVNLIDLAPGSIAKSSATAPKSTRVSALCAALADALIAAFVRQWGAHDGCRDPRGGVNSPRDYGGSAISSCEIDSTFVAAHPWIRRRAEEYRAWNWVYGKTPRFEQALRLGEEAARLHVERGRIVEVDLNGAAANAGAEAWRERVLGVEYSPAISLLRPALPDNAPQEEPLWSIAD